MRRVLAVLLVAGCAIGAYFYFTPRMTLADLGKGFETGDQELLEENINFPKLRENLKGQLNVMMMDRVSQSEDSTGLGALGAGIATLFLDKLVDAFLTPAGLAALSRGDASLAGSTPSSPDTDGSGVFEDARLEYASLSKVYVFVPNDEGEETRFVLRREGLSWKLTNIVLPSE